MPASEMVRRVATAISGAPFPSPASERKARAAIEAMRYPPERVLDALNYGRDSAFRADFLREWHKVIDAALTAEATDAKA